MKDIGKRYEKLRGYIYGYAQRFHQYGALSRQEAAILEKSAKEILRLGGINHYNFAKRILAANSEALS